MSSATKTLVASATTTTPFLVLGETRKRAIEARLTKCVGAWRRDWCAQDDNADQVTDQAIVVEPAPADIVEQLFADIAYGAQGRAASATGVYALATATGVTAALGLSDSVAGSDSQSMPRSVLADSVAREMVASLARTILLDVQYQAAQIDVAPVSAGAQDASRAHWWRVTVYPGLTMLLAPQLLVLLAPAGKYTPSAVVDKRRAAIASETVALEVVLGEAQVSVGELSSLRINDVVVLSGAISQPGQLRTRSGQHVANVSLGRVEGKRAVAIVK